MQNLHTLLKYKHKLHGVTFLTHRVYNGDDDLLVQPVEHHTCVLVIRYSITV